VESGGSFNPSVKISFMLPVSEANLSVANLVACVSKRKKERESVCVCVCVRERERERERERTLH
jgi:hypothetical protein